MKIPVANLYHLLLYAWDKLAEGAVVDVGGTEAENLPNLFARVLVNGTTHVLRRGLDRGYLSTSELTARPRGRINVAASVSDISLARRQLVCDVDDLQYDVVHNRIIKTTLRELAAADDLDPELRFKLTLLHRRLDLVREIRLSSAVFRRVQLTRSNSFYGFLLDVCQLVHRSLLPEPVSGRTRFRDFRGNDREMADLFEAFVRNYFRHRLPSPWKVQRTKMMWHDATGAEEHLPFLPIMHTDVTLRHPSRRVIIDAKYYKEPFDFRYNQPKIRSTNLYQIYAYLRNYRVIAPDFDLSGLLLYATAGSTFDMEYTLLGERIRVAAVDLSAHWTEIEERLLGLVLRQGSGRDPVQSAQL